MNKEMPDNGDNCGLYSRIKWLFLIDISIYRKQYHFKNRIHKRLSIFKQVTAWLKSYFVGYASLYREKVNVVLTAKKIKFVCIILPHPLIFLFAFG